VGAAAGLAAAIIGCLFAVSLLAVGERRTRLVPTEIEMSPSEEESRPEKTPARPLAVMTLNLAHGRKQGPHQLLQSAASIRANLDDAAAVILRERPDVVALQEADGPSIWSGRFDHVDHLARASRMRYHVRAENVKGLKLSYGTALLARWPLEEVVAFTFSASPPTFCKGFVVTTVRLPEPAGRKVDVVSVHLDFFRGTVRVKQVDQMVAELRARENPLIVMGDFNCQWTDRGSPIRTLAAELGLKAYRPEAEGMGTFAKSNKRLDWILISRELEFVSYRVLPDAVSDHCGVVATIRAVGSEEAASR
jgi:endonuclease/exonuclease/phosphatase family metal-dependent hydrolase